MRRAAWWPLALTADALLAVTSCSTEPTPTAPPSANPAAPVKPAADQLPPGMLRLGDGQAIEIAKSWTLTLGKLEEVQPSPKAQGLPAGWKALASTAVFTSSSPDLDTVPTGVSLAARYGQDGRTAPLFTDTTITGLPHTSMTDSSDPVRVPPRGSHTVRIGFAVPPDSAGQPLTLTLGQGWDTKYLEGRIPGGLVQPGITAAIKPVDNKQKALAFGDWYAGNGSPWVRIGAVKVTGTDPSGQKTCEAEVSFFNSDKEVAQLGQTPVTGDVRVYYGTDLKKADTVKELLGFTEAFVAPQRTATVTSHFTLPPQAVPGPLTLELGDMGRTVATYTGDIRN